MAARVAGAGPLRLMFRTILPNCMAPLIVQATLSFSNAILDAAALGFLGMGAQPPTPEWGTMLAEAREFILRAWWVVTFPGLAILITVLAINLMGDGLRDALDPGSSAAEPGTDGSSRNQQSLRRLRHGPWPFRAVDGVSLASTRAKCWPSSANSGPASRLPCWPSWASCRGPPRSPPTDLAFDGSDLLAIDRRASAARIIGKDMAMIFQEPMSSLNPCFTVGFQLIEALKVHLDMRQGRAPRPRHRAPAPGRHSATPSGGSAPSRTSCRAA